MLNAFEATDAGRQLIEIIREQKGDHEFRLLIERVDGAWEIVMSIPPHDERHKARGVGSTLDAAWNGMNPLWA